MVTVIVRVDQRSLHRAEVADGGVEDGVRVAVDVLARLGDEPQDRQGRNETEEPYGRRPEARRESEQGPGRNEREQDPPRQRQERDDRCGLEAVDRGEDRT
jgi:hypothetical protein